MNYENIAYSEEEKQKIEENKMAICEWIMANIVPKISDNEVLRVDFGGTYHAINGGSTEKYHFHVYGKTNRFYFHGFLGESNIGFAKQFGGYVPFEKTCTRDAHPIIDNWKMVKEELLNKIVERNETKKNIFAFEV